MSVTSYSIAYVQKNMQLLCAVFLATALALNPFQFWLSNIALLLFVLTLFINFKELKFNYNLSLLLPIGFFATMVISMFWTTNIGATLKGIQKGSVFLVLPLLFLFAGFFDNNMKKNIIRFYASGMSFYAIYCFICAFLKFLETGNKNVFLFHNLVSLDVNAIYIATFASFCMFYFVQLQQKKAFDFIALYILFFFVLLLSSKTMLFVDCCLIVWYYLQHSKTLRSVKLATIAMALTFVFVSIVYVKNIQIRFLQEYQTAFVDNTINQKHATLTDKVVNISLQQAWRKEKFIDTDFIPGTALRVFHIRLFKEIVQEQKILFFGLGQDASENVIKQKYHQYQLFKGFSYFNLHNQFAQVYTELGIVGFIFFITMIFMNFKNAYRNSDFLHTVFAFSTFVLFLTESVLCRQRGIVFFIILYCIFNMANQSKTSIK